MTTIPPFSIEEGSSQNEVQVFLHLLILDGDVGAWPFAPRRSGSGVAAAVGRHLLPHLWLYRRHRRFPDS